MTICLSPIITPFSKPNCYLPSFQDHIFQAKHNLAFLETVNQAAKDCYDWQVTACFYSAVHLINAHLSLHNMQYRKHVDVRDAINPKNAEAVQKGSALADGVYLAYVKLQSLSRRSRYLVNDNDGNLASQQAFMTYDVHLARALRHLNTLIVFFTSQYALSFDQIAISCPGIKPGELSFCK